MRPVLLLAALVAAPAAAQPPAPAEAPVVNEVILFGDDPCPPSTEEAITVCARLPEEDRFRIPEDLRPQPDDPAGRSWYDRAIELSYVGRTGTDSCSPVGPGGFTGCHSRLLRAASAERAQPRNSWARLIAAARQERLDRIAAEEEAAEDAELTGGVDE